MADFLLGHIVDIHREDKFQDKFVPAIHQSLHSVQVLGADMKCQRGVYQMTNDVKLGDLYDDSRMTDVKFSDDDDEEGKRQRVIAILSRGWVKLPFEGATEILARVCKARVVVGFWPDESASRVCNEPNGAGASLIAFTTERNGYKTPENGLSSGFLGSAIDANPGQNRTGDDGVSVGYSDRMDLCENGLSFVSRQ
jgi:hypothetical protein